MRTSRFNKFIFCSLLPLIFIISEISADPGSVLEGYQRLGEIRENAGMSGLQPELTLERAAQNHAEYLSINQKISHFQVEDLPNFTGKTPADRAIYEGYESLAVLENFSSGQENIFYSIDGLMGAIYHRLAFLDFFINEVGIGITSDRGTPYFVFNMGNSQLNNYCQRAPSIERGLYISKACKNARRIPADQYHQLKKQTEVKNPKLVLWPPQQGEEIPTTFYEEIPDPLPDLSISGYPISIQFNPYYFDSVKILSFKLFDADLGVQVRETRLINSQNDVSKKFNKLQFALFPLAPLSWANYYRAEVEYETQGEAHKKTWFFRTQDPPLALFNIKGAGETLQLIESREYSIHILPRPGYPVISNLNWRASEKVSVKVEKDDNNTLRLTLVGEQCETVHFALNGDRLFKVQISDDDNLNDNDFYPQSPVIQCQSRYERELPGYKIEAKGEDLRMINAQDYWVTIKSENDVEMTLGAKYPSNMKIRIVPLNRSSFKINLQGKIGQQVDFYTSEGGTFRVILRY